MNQNKIKARGRIAVLGILVIVGFISGLFLTKTGSGNTIKQRESISSITNKNNISSITNKNNISSFINKNNKPITNKNNQLLITNTIPYNTPTSSSISFNNTGDIFKPVFLSYTYDDNITKLNNHLLNVMSSDNAVTPNSIKHNKSKLKKKLKKKHNKNKRLNTIYKIQGKGYSSMLKPELQDYLFKKCMKAGIGEYYKLLQAQMYCESNFKSDIISGTNDYGLMQINIVNHKWLSKKLGKNNFLDPYTSIDAGVLIMSGFLKKYNDAETALVCYNMGEGAVINRGIYSSIYSRKIIKHMSLLKEVKENDIKKG